MGSKVAVAVALAAISMVAIGCSTPPSVDCTEALADFGEKNQAVSADVTACLAGNETIKCVCDIYNDIIDQGRELVDETCKGASEEARLRAILDGLIAARGAAEQF